MKKITLSADFKKELADRRTPDGWQKFFIFLDGEYCCFDCAKADEEQISQAIDYQNDDEVFDNSLVIKEVDNFGDNKTLNHIDCVVCGERVEKFEGED